MSYIVTVKLAKNKKHDPYNKQTGACPVSEHCTDVTGEHHSFLTELDDPNLIRRVFGKAAAGSGMQITRIERI